MKTLLSLVLALTAMSAHAQLYKWTDANGKVQYSDRPQDGSNATAIATPRAQSAVAPASDNWREREIASRESRIKMAEAERRRAAVAAEAEKNAPEPFNPSMHRSGKVMSEDELCTRDQQQLEYAQKTKNLAIGHGSGPAVTLTEAQRQQVIAERKANHQLACGSASRR